GWPPTRWVRHLRPDPLRRLHLRPAERREVRSMVRSSVPEPNPVQRAQVESAVRVACDEAAGQLPLAWQAVVRQAAGARTDDVRDALDAAVVRTDLGIDRTPLWWRAGSAVQWVLAAAAAVGLVWLVLLGVNGWLRLPDPPTPTWLGLPVPTLL